MKKNVKINKLKIKNILKLEIKYLKGYDKNKESSYIQYWDVNNLYGQKMLQKFPVNNFEWIQK